MGRAGVVGITLEYEVSGSGEPVVLIHGALIGPGSERSTNSC
jgi:hypothetical protein